jgi:tagatose 6-phosphate kinase
VLAARGAPSNRPIVTVTLNAALDVTYGVSRVRWGEANRVSTVIRRAGGKGLNVARVLHALGRNVVVTGFAGGDTGNAIRADLEEAQIHDRLVNTSAESRRTLVVAESDQATVLNEPGPLISGLEWAAFLTTLNGLLTDCAAIVVSGSIPPGIHEDAYALILRMASNAGVPAVLDAAAQPLRAGLAGRPAIAKPNLRELEEIVGRPAPNLLDVLQSAGELRALGAESVVVTRGADGLVASTPEGSWFGRVPARMSGNPTGAGDAVAAAIAIGLVDSKPWPELLTDSLAIGAAAVSGRSAGDVDLGAYETLRTAVRLESL